MPGEAGTICSTCGAHNREPRTTCQQCGEALAKLPEIKPGFLLAARYEIQEPLGVGGMGMVYKAHDRLLNEAVAIKVLRPEAAQATDIAARFISEIKLARAVSHKNVARIHEYGEDRGLRYISMAFVDGVDLKRVLRERGPFPLSQAFEIAIHVAEGLHAIHEEGIVHRDLKSSNIMLDGRGVVRLMDFGIAKLWSTELAEDMTATGQIIGTPEYMSPEQIRGRKLDRRSDIYSLAVVIYELFTGCTPFRGDTPVATLVMQLNDLPPLEGPPAQCVPKSVVPLLRKALAKDPEGRFTTALEMARALEHAQTAGGSGARTAVPVLSETAPSESPRGRDRPPAAPWAEVVPTVSLVPTAVPPPVTSDSDPPTLARRGRPAFLALISVLGVVAVGGLAFLTGRGADRTRGGVIRDRSLSTESQSPGDTLDSVAVRGSAAPTAVPVPPAKPSAPTSSTPVRPAREAPARPLDGPARVTADARAGDSRGALGIVDAQAQERRQTEARVETLLTDAGMALEAQRYEAAIALYDEILKLDRRQQMALIGRATAVNAKDAAKAATTPAPGRARAFVPGKTSASSADAGPARALSEAFEDVPGTDVQQVTHPTLPPGWIEFEARPAAPKAGERYTLKVYFVNPVKAPIEIREMIVTNTINGGKSSGPVTPTTRTVAPGQKGLLLSLADFLAENTETWSLEVLVRTTGGESYRNQIVWK